MNRTMQTIIMTRTLEPSPLLLLPPPLLPVLVALVAPPLPQVVEDPYTDFAKHAP